MVRTEMLPWQAPQHEQLAAQMRADQVPHALLFAGPRHVGKDRFAEDFCKLLLCESPAGGVHCGLCKACGLTEAGSHGDFRRLQPEASSRVIKIDQVRAAVEFAYKTAAFGGRKVLLISPAEALNVNAANALLKCLEEPPPGTHIILVSHQPQALPATIRSRCQIIRFPCPPEDASLRWLACMIEGRGAEDALAADEGRPLLALILHREEQVDRVAQLGIALDALLSGNLSAAVAAQAMDGEDLTENLARLSLCLRNRIRQQMCSGAVTGDVRALFRTLDELQGYQRAEARGSNPNAPLVVDTLLSGVAPRRAS